MQTAFRQVDSDFLDLLPELILEIDSDLNIRFVNKSCESILGYTKQELVNKKIALETFFAKSDIEKLKLNLKTFFNGAHISGNCYKVHKKSGEEIVLEFYNSHIKKNDKVIGLRCIAIDVTEKQKEHIEITNQAKNYLQIFHNFPLPYQSLNENGAILDVNPSWCEILGYSREEVIGEFFSTLLSKRYINKFEESFAIFKEKGTADDIHFEILKKDGTNIYVNFNGKIEYDDNKMFLRTHCVLNDITLQQKAEQTLIRSEERLRELNATKDKFFSIIAHDLKNPFNDLMGFTQLLALNIEKYDKIKIEQFASIIHQSSKLAYNLLENLLDWSRAQTGTLKFKPEKILINKLVNENIELLESTAHNKNIRIYPEIDNEIYAYADKNMIRTIIRNLISNAIKYTKQGGHISIRSYCGESCKISVADTGIGISSENISKLFKIDEGFSTIGTEREKGTGLGLILCKEFVEKNGGELKVESEAGKGSTFTFTLPLPEPEY